MQLVNTLQTSKITASEVTEQLETSETTEINIDLAREVSFRLSLEGRGPASRSGSCLPVAPTLNAYRGLSDPAAVQVMTQAFQC